MNFIQNLREKTKEQYKNRLVHGLEGWVSTGLIQRSPDNCDRPSTYLIFFYFFNRWIKYHYILKNKIDDAVIDLLRF